MNPLLLIMNARRIPSCLSAIAGLHIDTVWMTGYSEFQLERIISKVVEVHDDRTHYLVLSDDCEPTQHAVDAVLSLLEDGHDVATGYCNMDTQPDNDLVNLTRSPLKTDTPHLSSYDFWTQSDIDALDADVFRSWFTGMSLTAMTRDMWQRFPFDAYGRPGNASDYNLSYRLQRAGIPITAHRQGRVHHVKRKLNTPDTDDEKRVLLGQLKQQCVYRKATDTRLPDWHDD